MASVKTEKQLPPSVRAQYLKALTAFELRNYAYGITLVQEVLRQEPAFLEGRRALRQICIAQSKGKKSFLGFSGTSTLSVMKAQNLLKKGDAAGAMDEAEKILESDPFNIAANQALRDAALDLELYETARFALETLREGHPKDIKVLHELGQLYYSHDEPAKAIEVFNDILAISPNDMVAVKSLKDASAADSMKSGGWNTAESYRDLIKDKEQAVLLEQQNRSVRDEDVIENQLAALTVQYNENQQNIDVVRKIASLYEQKNDLETAVQWYSYAASLTQNTDAALVRKATDLQDRLYDQYIRTCQEFIAAHPGHESLPEYTQRLTEYLKLRAESRIGEARKRVERNPTDLMLQFELGEVLCDTGAWREAIPALQASRKSPNVRLKAMNLLGQCYQQLNMLDLAVKTFEDAAKELLVMDDTKKQIVYNLGLVMEQMARKDAALDCFKQIYEVDYGYKDVAHRVESSYGA